MHVCRFTSASIQRSSADCLKPTPLHHVRILYFFQDARVQARHPLSCNLQASEQDHPADSTQETSKTLFLNLR